MTSSPHKALFPAALQARTQGAFEARHGASLAHEQERLTVTARRMGDSVVASVVIATADRTFVYTMEAALLLSRYKGLRPDQALNLCLDFLDWYLGEFFESQRETLLPLDWQPHSMGDVELMARGTLRNAFLDDAADAWLRGERPDVEAAYKAIKAARREE